VLVGIVSLVLGLDSVLYSVVVPVLPQYARQLQLGPGRAGLLYGCYAVALLAAAPVAGWIGDRRGHWSPLVFGTAGIAVATVGFSVAHAYPLLVMARCLQGASAGAVWTSGIAVMAERVPPARLGGAMGTAMGSLSVGMILGPPLSGLLVTRWGTSAPYNVCAAVALAMAVILPVLIERREPPVSPPVGGPAVLRNPAARSILVGVGLGACALSFLEPMLPLHLAATLGTGPLPIGLLFGLATLTNALASVAVGRLVDRCPDVRPAGAALVVIGAATALVAWPRQLAVIAVLLAVLGIAYAVILVPALPRLAALPVPGAEPGTGRQNLGRVYAAFNIAYAIGMGAGPLTGGVLVARTGTGTAFAVAGVVVAGAGMGDMLRRGRSPSRSAAGR
jgi:MFS family permease